jgi:hypothetical protein
MKKPLMIVGSLVLFSALLIGYGTYMSDTYADDGQREASVLIEHFETVWYSDVALLAGLRGDAQVSDKELKSLHAPYGYLLEWLDLLGPSVSVEILEHSKAVFLGARDFKAPVGLGAVRSRYCYVISSNGQREFDLRMRLAHVPVSAAARAPVWEWLARPAEGEPDQRHFYAAQVAHSFVVVSNNLKDLQTVVEKLSVSDQNAQSASHIRGWEIVSQKNLWGYRKYRHGEHGDQMAAGTSGVPTSAEILMFWCDMEKKTCVLRFLSHPDDEEFATRFTAGSVLPPLNRQGRGVWEVVIPFQGSELSVEHIFTVMWLMGVGIYL